MDRGIGRITAALQRTGRLDNTLILFTIDNGGCHVEYATTRKGAYLPERTRDGRAMVPGNVPDLMPGPEITYQSYGYGWANASNTPYRLFKQFDHEGGIHTPMIAHWPKGITNAGGIVPQVAHLIDVTPTLLDVTQTKLPETIDNRPPLALDGTSLSAALKGSPTPGHETLFFDHNKGRAIRDGRWKLVQVKSAEWELYDIVADPNELHDLAAQMPDRVERLARRWEEWSALQRERNASR
jgi:arylsulfatase